MVKKTLTVTVSVLESTLIAIKRKAGTGQTKAAMETMIDSYLAEKKR